MEEESELEAEVNRRILFVQNEEQLKGKMKRQPDCTITSVVCRRQCRMIPDQLDIPELRNKTIHSIFYQYEPGDIYIGGSEGTLLRHNSSSTRVYDTDLEGDILYVNFHEGSSTGQGKSLIAIARRKLYVYDIDESEPRHVIDIEAIRSARFKKNCALITYRNGCIDEFTLSTRGVTIETLLVDNAQSPSPYIKTSNGNAPLNSTVKVQLTNLNGHMAIDGAHHADNKVWFLISKRTVSDEMADKNGVKFVGFFNHIGAIVDRTNTLWIHHCNRGNFLEILYRETFEREVTAVTLSKYRVSVALGDVVVFVEFVECATDQNGGS